MLVMKQIKETIKEFKNDLTGKTGKQTSILFLSQFLALGLGFIISIINTKVLGPTGFGVLSFFLSITSFILIFFRFGFFNSSGLLIAETKDKTKERELTGTSIIIAFFIGISFSLFILIFSFFIDGIFNTNIGWILRYTSFILIGLPLSLLIPQIGRGSNKIGNISIFNILPKAIYIIGAIMLMGMIHVDPYHFILLHLLSTTISIIAVMHLFHPVFRNITNNLKAIWKKNKEYGIHIYIGGVVNQSTYYLDGILIVYFLNTLQLGYYSLAVLMTLPMVGLSQALSASLFKKYVNMKRIPKKVMQYNFIWLSCCTVGLILFGKLIVTTVFTEDFLPVVPLILPLALAAFFQGMYQPYSFLAAKGKGKWLKNVAYLEGTNNLIGNIVLIYFYGIYGAAVATLLSKLIHWTMLRYYYKKYINEDHEHGE